MAARELTPLTPAFWDADWSVAALAPGEQIERPPVEMGAGLVLFRTSGSEGRPKWVGLSRGALQASAEAVNGFLAVEKSSVWARFLPRHHVGGFGVEARAFFAGCTCVSSDEKWNADRFAAACAASAVTHTSLVPTQVFDLVEAKILAPSSLRAVVVGGGALAPALASAARALGWPVLASYGLTEAASQVATQSPHAADGQELEILPHWHVETDADRRAVLAGPALATCHIAKVDESWQRIDFHGRFVTADRVEIRNRRLRFLGRADSVIKVLGELVDLASLRRRIDDAAVAASCFGRVRLTPEPDGRRGTRLVLECLAEPEGAAVAAAVNAAQPPFARLVEVRVTDDLRLSPLGKPML